MLHLVQIVHPRLGRRVARVKANRLHLLRRYRSIYSLALESIRRDQPIPGITAESASGETLDYDSIYSGASEWQLLASFDHPAEPSRCLVSGTGLTHQASADNRQAMHEAQAAGSATDSMRMYQWGVEGGRPCPGEIGTAPEWFYKGQGHILRAHLQALVVPPFAEDGGEEPEVAGAYLIDDHGEPWRIGWTTANEFSDHVLEKRNYLYLAPSKLRHCAIGPELVVGNDLSKAEGKVRIERQGQTVWSKSILSGESNMCHSIANLEHHHFKYDLHRNPGDVHIHFLGADAFSFGDGIQLADGDVMEIAWRGFGRPLRNPLAIDPEPVALVRVNALR